MNRNEKQDLYFMVFRGSAALVVGILAVIIGFILIGGIGKLSWDFLTQVPKIDSQGALTKGGIFPAIVGTVYLMLVVLAFAVPVGVLGAVYLVEYQGKSRFANSVWIIVHNLAGVPSIVYGLLGLGLLVAYLNLDVGILVAGITLGLLVLPVIIVTTREALDLRAFHGQGGVLGDGRDKVADRLASRHTLCDAGDIDRNDIVIVEGSR